jgi:esterase/lipase
MKKYTLRTRFKKDIVCEFVAPKKKTNKVIILCGGMPGYPGGKDETLFWLAERGYWVFLPRYRGTWESGGSFLKVSPHQDVLDIIEELPKGFKDLWADKVLKIKNPEVYLIGSSFGGPAVILASTSARVKKVVAFSPVIDWERENENKLEPIESLKKFTVEAFGEGYRFTEKNWQKLESGKFYNPITEVKNLKAEKIFIIHAKDDKIVFTDPAVKFSKQLGNKFLLLETGGHLSSSNVIKPEFWKKIKQFFK